MLVGGMDAEVEEQILWRQGQVANGIDSDGLGALPEFVYIIVGRVLFGDVPVEFYHGGALLDQAGQMAHDSGVTLNLRQVV